MWVYAAAAIAALSIGFAGGWRVATWRADAEAAELQRQTAADAARRFEHATAAARTYEATREAQRVRTVTVTREVAREVQADVDCAARDLPLSLRSALERAAGSHADQPGPARPLLTAPAASAANLGRPGT
jgi:hypothetical protein